MPYLPLKVCLGCGVAIPPGSPKSRCHPCRKKLWKADWIKRAPKYAVDKNSPNGSRSRSRESQRVLLRPSIPFFPAATEKSLSDRVQTTVAIRTRPLYNGKSEPIGDYTPPTPAMLRAATIERIRRDGPKSSDTIEDIAESGWTPPTLEETIKRRYA